MHIVAPLRMISCIRCYKNVGTTMMYFVEGVATANETEIRKHLPWVFNGSSLPRPIEVDSMLDEWSTYGLEVTWNTNNNQILEVWRVSDVNPSADGNNEFDLQIGLWVEREVLKKMAPSLLQNYITNFHELPPSKKEAGMKSPTCKPLRRSVRIEKLRAQTPVKSVT